MQVLDDLPRTPEVEKTLPQAEFLLRHHDAVASLAVVQ